MWRWLISGVAAVFMERGFQSQGVLTLTGRQGLGKTRWLKSLVPNRDWIKDGVVLNPKDKDSVLQSVSRWIVELGELDATFKKADVAALKAFITMEEDVLRQAYAQKTDKYQRCKAALKIDPPSASNIDPSEKCKKVSFCA
jgi:putative DNA primase/helicase